MLRGRIVQLEAQQQQPTMFVEFVGDAYGNNSGTMDYKSTAKVALQVVGRSAHYHASLQFDQWRVANPTFVVVSKRLELVSHPIAYNGSDVVTNVSAVLHVAYLTK